ncbi:MAG TPA: methylated-DNA--[protein]-cysteine S-methyltransferase, partial [Thermoanaerobaculia bacterium]|nr:methylated-DNA--[protein]-cysteine S-methyltransferase [Thermoanaerobaculia bacterium]
LVAGTDRGLCFVGLGEGPARLERSLAEEFPQATLLRDDQVLGDVVRAVLDRVRGAEPHGELPLDIRATAFQRRVWTALQRIPSGETITYAELARRIGRPSAIRAVGAANGANPVPVIVPCHRVIGADGTLTGYGGGIERKQWLLALEGRRLF